ERLEAERKEQERLEAERLEAERKEQERLEAERLEAERKEQERLEAEQIEVSTMILKIKEEISELEEIVSKNK
ncbi:signal recognition particle-docking protein FtsY, partial [Clostridium botulinum]|nr:signal recognition particle-docking protein FtsY [Clostridium botulinum]